MQGADEAPSTLLTELKKPHANLRRFSNPQWPRSWRRCSEVTVSDLQVAERCASFPSFWSATHLFSLSILFPGANVALPSNLPLSFTLGSPEEACNANLSVANLVFILYSRLQGTNQVNFREGQKKWKPEQISSFEFQQWASHPDTFFLARLNSLQHLGGPEDGQEEGGGGGGGEVKEEGKLALTQCRPALS